MTRFFFVDYTRAALLLLMISAHSLYLAINIPNTNISITPLLPLGWATTSFVMLTGFTISFILAKKYDIAKLSHELKVRFYKLIVVMFASNIFYKIVPNISLHDLNTIELIDLTKNAFIFNKYWSISGVLLPTSLTIIIISLILNIFCDRYNFVIKLTLISIISVFIIYKIKFSEIYAYDRNYIIDLFFIYGAGGFPVIGFVMYGLIGYITGEFLKKHINNKLITCSYIVFSIVILINHYYVKLPLFDFIDNILIPTAKFSTILFCCYLLAKLFNKLDLLIVFSKYSLFVFIAHRAFLQFYNKVLGSTLVIGAYRYYLLFVMTVVTLYFICKVRQRYTFIDACLTKVYL